MKNELNLSEQEFFKKGIRTIWIIWGTMLFSLYIYVRICHMLEPSWEPLVDFSFPVNVLKIAIYIVCAPLLLFSVYFRNYIMNSQSEKNEANYIKRASKNNNHPAVVKYGTAVIVSIAVSESIGILGFGLFLLSKDFKSLYILAAISAMAMLYHRPQRRELDKVASTMKHTQ